MKKTILYTVAAISIAALAAIVIIGCNNGENSDSEGLNKFLGSFTGREQGDVDDDGKDGYYSVTVVNGSIVNYEKDNKYKAGALVMIKTEDERDGQKFRGWASSSDGVSFDNSKTVTTFFYMPPRSVKIEATFGSVPKYTVTYDGNGNTAGSAPIDPNSPYDSGATVEAMKYGNLVNKGHSFSAWSTQKSGGPRINENETFIITGPTTLYAVWREATATTFEVKVEGGNGGGPYEVGDMVTVTAVSTSSDQKFYKWTASPSVTFKNANESPTTFTMPDKDVTVTANFITEQKYKVTVISAAANSYGSGNHKAGDKVSIYAGTLSSGEKFKNWTVNTNNVTFDTNSDAISFEMPAGDVTVTANFEKDAGVWKGGLLDDFEDGNNVNALGGKWFFYTYQRAPSAELDDCQRKTYTDYITYDKLERIIDFVQDGPLLTFSSGGYGTSVTTPQEGNYSGVMQFENVGAPWDSPVNGNMWPDVYPGVGMGTFLTKDTLKGVGESFRDMNYIKFWIKMSKGIDTVIFKVDVADQLPQNASGWKDGDFTETIVDGVKKYKGSPNSKKGCPADASYQIFIRNDEPGKWLQKTIPLGTGPGKLERPTWEAEFKPYNWNKTHAIKISWEVAGERNDPIDKGMVAVDYIEITK